MKTKAVFVKELKAIVEYDINEKEEVVAVEAKIQKSRREDSYSYKGFMRLEDFKGYNPYSLKDVDVFFWCPDMEKFAQELEENHDIYACLKEIDKQDPFKIIKRKDFSKKDLLMVVSNDHSFSFIDGSKFNAPLHFDYCESHIYSGTHNLKAAREYLNNKEGVSQIKIIEVPCYNNDEGRNTHALEFTVRLSKKLYNEVYKESRYDVKKYVMYTYLDFTQFEIKKENYDDFAEEG